MVNIYRSSFKVIKRASIFLVLCSCVTPYDFSSSQFKQSIVVEGMITDQPGPYLVTITNLLPIDNQTGEKDYVTGATVTIKDDQGNSEVLVEKSSGNYYTNTLQGVIGNTYTLSIITSEGSTYESTAEKLLPVGDFSILEPQFVQKEPPLTNRQITSKNGFNIYLDSDVLPEQEGRVWWRWTGTFEIFTYPSLKVKAGDGKALTWVPDPPSCSGYYVVRGVLIGPRFACQCCNCWVSQYNQVPLISDPSFVNDNKINNHYVGFVEANVRTMYDKYYLELEQLSCSQEIYDFWKKVKAQQANSSNLFQTPPAKTSGNINAKSKDAIPAIGYFAASAVVKHVIVLDKTNVPYPVLPMDTVATSCKEVYKNSSAQKPVFW